MKALLCLCISMCSTFCATQLSYLGSDPSTWSRRTIATPSATSSSREHSTYIGDLNEYHIAGIVSDASGNIYATGSRIIRPDLYSADLPVRSEVFVTKLDTAGSVMFTATIGGKSVDTASALTIDPAGNIWVVGDTNSTDFPLRAPLQTQRTNSNPPFTGFILKLSGDGALLFSSYLGGTDGFSTVNAITSDRAGNVYMTGETLATDFRATPGLQFGTAAGLYFTTSQRTAAFAVKLPSSADRISLAAVIAGSQNGGVCLGFSNCSFQPRWTRAYAIAVDESGNFTIAGDTSTRDLPVTPAAFRTSQREGAFVAKIRADGDGLVYLTYFPATISEIVADSQGSLVISGTVNQLSEGFSATMNTIQPTYGGGSDAVAAKLKPDGSGVTWATYLGGSGEDKASSLALDSQGNVWVAGTTASPDFPSPDVDKQGGALLSGGEFVVALSPNASKLQFSRRYPAGTCAQSIAVDRGGLLHMAGGLGLVSTMLPGQPPTPRILGVANAAFASGVSGRIAPAELISIYGVGIGPDTSSGPILNESGRIATELAGTRVLIGGLPAPLLYVSPNQINVVVPVKLPTQRSVTISVIASGARAFDFEVMVDDTAPQIFRNFDGTIAAINEDGTVNTESNPARPGSTVAFWATGVGAYTYIPDGTLFGAEAVYFKCLTCAVVDGRGGSQLNMVYAGGAPSMVSGVVQVNLQVPDQDYDLSVQLRTQAPGSVAGNRYSTPATLFVKR